MERWPDWARWLAVVPAAFAGALLARFVIIQTLSGFMSDAGGRPSVDSGVVQFFQQIFGPMAALSAGAAAAPHHKAVTAAVLGVAFFGLATFLVLSGAGDWNPLGLLMNVVGVVAGVFIARSFDQKASA